MYTTLDTFTAYISRYILLKKTPQFSVEFTHKKLTPGLHGKNTEISYVEKAKKIYVYITFLSLLALTSAKIIDQLIQTHEINIQSNHKHVKLSK